MEKHTGEPTNSLLQEGQASGAMTVEQWDTIYPELEQVTQPTKEKPFTFWRDSSGGLYKVNFQTQAEGAVSTRERRQTMVNIVRTTEEGMEAWLK